jgi:putative addiction module killer protein
MDQGFQVQLYKTASKDCPFSDWMNGLDDSVKGRIYYGINQLKAGNMQRCKWLSKGLWELKFGFGPGYRIYLTIHHDDVILLCSGDKSTQQKDIKKAKRYLVEWRKRR